MKKGNKYNNTGTQEVEDFIDPSRRPSKISAGLRGAKQPQHGMIQGLNSVQKSSGIALRKNRNFVVHGIPEQLIKEEAAGGRGDNVLRSKSALIGRNNGG